MTQQALIGWAVLTVFLVAGADIESTSKLAQAFAWLVLLAVLMGYGPAAFTRLTRAMGQGAASSTSGAAPAPTGGGSARAL